MTPTERVLRLRAHALANIDAVGIDRELNDLLAARGWRASAGEPWMVLRRAQQQAAILGGMPPVIDAGELIVGKTCNRALTTEEQTELIRDRETIEPHFLKAPGMNSHMSIDFEQLLALGVVGIRKQIGDYRVQLDPADPVQMEQDVFYQACLISLNALVDFSQQYADEAENQAKNTSSIERKAELLNIADICRRVPEYPAESFAEALQCAHFVTFSLCLATQTFLFQYGHPDRYLLEYYRRDLAEGRITPEKAQELIDCLSILLTEYTPQHLAVGWRLGGRDVAGKDVCNELTVMFLRSLNHVPLAYPCTGLAWTSDTPEAVKELAIQMLANGHSHPAIFNDAVITAGLKELGLRDDEACLYQHSTCVEITPCGASNVYVASPYINLPQLLLDVLEKESLPDFGSLLQAYHDHLAEVLAEAVREQNTLQMMRRYYGGNPLLSCFVNDCLQRGQDIDHGGARYNWIEPSFVGLSNLVDSLYALRVQVFERSVLAMKELKQHLAVDFAGCEAERCLLENRIHKYGNDQDDVDDLAAVITNWVAELTSQHRTYLGDRYVSGFFCWVMHERLGHETGATPDGRHAGFPLGDGSGPAQGREKNGPTAAILSTTKWNHQTHIGGIALNLKFTPPKDQVLFRAHLLNLIETYVTRGGFEVQINVVDRAKLEAAQAHPQEYQDLVVRIGGYSDYFVRLSPEMQAEVLLRTEHEGS